MVWFEKRVGRPHTTALAGTGLFDVGMFYETKTRKPIDLIGGDKSGIDHHFQ